MRRIFQYSLTLALLCVWAPAQTVTYTTIHQFNGAGGSGSYALVEAPDGTFYGVTISGGLANEGVAFQMALSGTPYNVLSSFAEPNYPYSPLVEAGDGNFYGSLFSTETYKLTSAGNVSVLSSSYIVNSYITGKDGNLYFLKGAYGDLYELVVATGAIQDIATPPLSSLATVANLVQTGDGSFWCLAYLYDSDEPSQSQSFIFNLTTGDSYSLPSTMETNVASSLIVGADGQLYAPVADSVGYKSGYFIKFNPSTGQFTTLYTFATEQMAAPYILASDGNFYGIANQGSFTRVTPSGEYTDFGLVPYAAPMTTLLQGSDGAFYASGIDGDYGSLYKIALDPPLPPPILLSLGSTSIIQDASTTLSWSVSGMYGGSAGYCFATSNDPEWSGTQPLSGQKTLMPTAVGAYQYALTCGGTTSGLTSLTVTSNGKVNTSTSLQASPNPVTVGSSATLTATVSPVTGTTVPSGTVTFMDGPTTIGNASLNAAGVATLSDNTAGFAPGTYTVSARYNGSSSFNPSTSSTTQITLTSKIATSVVLSAAPANLVEGNKVTLNVKVQPAQGGGVPAGTVTLSVSSQVIATLALSAGSASVTASTAGITPAGYTVTAAYSGSASYQPSSATTRVAVQWPTTTTLSVQPNPVVQGGTLTLVATIGSGNSNGPAGTVQFKVGPSVVGSASVAGGTASLSIPTGDIPQGAYGVTAAYSGDANDGTSSSAVVDVEID